jgi:hypothetical protein
MKPFPIDLVHQLLATHFQTLKSLMNEDRHRLPAITARYRLLKELIEKRYDKSVNILIAGSYCRQHDGSVYASACIEAFSEKPKAVLYLPALMDRYQDLENTGDKHWKEQFETLTVISLLHELDHLASGNVTSLDGDTDTSPEGRVRREKNTWALTCEFAIWHLVENGMHLDGGIATMYLGWLESGCDASSARWEAFVRKAYEPSLSRKPG